MNLHAGRWSRRISGQTSGVKDLGQALDILDKPSTPLFTNITGRKLLDLMSMEIPENVVKITRVG